MLCHLYVIEWHLVEVTQKYLEDTVKLNLLIPYFFLF